MPRNPPASKAVDPIIRYSHADWAEAAMMASVMKGQRAALWPAVAVVVVLAATCYPHVPGWELALMVVGRNAATPTFFSSRLMWRTASSPCMVSMPLKAWM